jgi:hypothetical protein
MMNRRLLGRTGTILAFFLLSIVAMFANWGVLYRSIAMVPSQGQSAEAILPDAYYITNNNMNNVQTPENQQPPHEHTQHRATDNLVRVDTEEKGTSVEFFITNETTTTQQEDVQKAHNNNNITSVPPTRTTDTHKKTTKKRAVVEFERQEGVVIATKLHGETYIALLEQSLCLFTQAYNNRLNYDIVVFTTLPIINKTLVASLQDLVAPARLSIVVDNDGFQNEIDKLSPVRSAKFLKRCNVTSPKNLTWWSTCAESTNDGSIGKLSYNWQAEFRSWHLWKHPALEPYRYMFWMDTDAFCSKVWDRDPIAYTIRHELVLFFDNFPQGRSKSREVQERIQRAFGGKTLCGIQLLEEEDGRFQAKTAGDDDCVKSSFPLVHGFLHITDLNFYRSEIGIQWSEALIGDEFLARRFDDQIAVTVLPAMLAPDKARDMRASGIQLDVYHNGYLDAKDRAGPFKKFWKRRGAAGFPEGNASCPIKVNG